MKKFLIALLILSMLLLMLPAGAYAAVRGLLPEYNNAVGFGTDQNKIRGCTLIAESAKRSDNVIIYGSSELRTDYISTHPSNFFTGGKGGFQVNLVGRGSCQSIIHALNIAANGESLRGKKIVLITSPQSYVPDGITADMFAANFSQQQFLRIMRGSLPSDMKLNFAQRVDSLLDSYKSEFGTDAPGTEASRTFASLYAGGNKVGRFLLSPYFALSSIIAETADAAEAGELLRATPEAAAHSPAEIDWDAEKEAALAAARVESDNNDFGIENDYYNTYIGSKLPRMKDKDSALSYSESVEYDDLRLLFEVCREYDITPLFVSVPLHGEWSDYCGFTAEKRAEYYSKVRGIADEYGVTVADFTDEEYTPYFLCDIMHLGWLGWLEVNHAVCEFIG